MKKLLALIACIALAITAYMGLHFFRPATPVTKLHINIPNNVTSSLFWVAQTAGYFKEENLQIEFTSYETGIEGLNNFIKNTDVDYCIIFTTPLVYKLIDGKNLRTISGLFTSNRMNRFFVKGYPGLDRAESLRGKRIAIQMGTSGEYIIYEILARNGLTTKDVRLINIPGSQIPDKVLKDEFDAFIDWIPFVNQAIDNLNSKNIAYWEPDPGYYQDYAVLTTDDYRLEKNKDSHARLLKSLYKALMLYEKSPEQFVDLAIQFPSSNYKKDQLIKDLKDANLTLGLSHELSQDLQLELRYACMHENRCNDATYDRLRQLFVDEPLLEAAPHLIRTNNIR